MERRQKEFVKRYLRRKPKVMILNSIKSLIAKNRTLANLLLAGIRFIRTMAYEAVIARFKIKPQKVIFCSHLGRNFSCSPKAIYEEMIRDSHYDGYEIIWAFDNPNNYSIARGEKTRYLSFKYLYHLSTSRYWVFNAKMPSNFRKKKGQTYLQTWHGTPLKRLAADIEVGEASTFYRSKMTREKMVESYLKDSARYDYMISANRFSTKAFISAFKIKKDVIIETGYPRNDVLFAATKDKADKLKEAYNVPKDKKVVLYAPTWRDNAYDEKGYVFELQVDFEKWHEALGVDYVVIYKPHYLIYDTKNKNMPKDFVIDASSCQDINDLYIISDMLVTDYSSVFFDYGVLKRPMLFYMYDLEQYRDNLRGFYLDIYKDLPGPVIEDENQLLQSIIDIDKVLAPYEKQIERFYEEYCSFDDGNASRRVLDIVFKQRME